MPARLLYSLLFLLAMPLVWLRLLWRARRQPDYLRHLGERHGHYPPPPPGPLLWLHAVSVGETRAAAPLIEALLQAYPGHTLLLTHMTPTGRATGAELAERHAGRVVQAYLPYDLPFFCARFLAHFRPRIGLLMETELWPNLIAAAAARDLPVLLVNARLSARSARGYARFAGLIRPALATLAGIAAQSEADAGRLRTLGARQVSVCGNLKFDMTPAPEALQRGEGWKAALAGRPLWLAASTRDGEEALLLDAFAVCLRAQPRLLLALVPRHPQRFETVASLVAARGLRFRRRSEDGVPTADTQVWLGDSMGEMAAWYAAADVALIGGSVLPFGGQNLIEAAACGCPVLVGPHTFNFAQAADDAIACGAALRVADAPAAGDAVLRLLAAPAERQAMREAALAFSRAHRGATERTVALVGVFYGQPAETFSGIRAGR